MRTRTAALATAFAFAAAALPAHAAPRRPACLTVAFSPDFARDRTMFCAYDVAYDASYVSRSSDGGRTWQPGRPFAEGDYKHFSPRLTVSPWFATDRRLFATAAGTTFESTDRGTTFKSFDDRSLDLASYSITGFLEPQPIGPPRPAFAYLRYTASVYVYDPQSGRRSTPGTIAKERPVVPLIPADYAATRQAVLLAQPSIGYYDTGDETALDFGLGAYTCVVDFVCRHRHFYFGNASLAYGAALAEAGSYVVVTRDNVHGPAAEHHAWRTNDYGRTWQPWTQLERLLPGTGFDNDGTVVLTASPDVPRRLFLHVTKRADPAKRGDADRQWFTLYRSDDNGTTWRKTGASSSETRGGTLPWNRAQWFAGVTLTAQPGGRLYVTAAHHTNGRIDYQGLFCSRDHGRTWRRGGC